MSLKNRITQAVAAKKSAEDSDLIEEKRALQTPMVSAEEQEWALRLHKKLVKIMDLSLISTMEENEARIQIRDVELAVPLSALDTIVRWDRRTTRLPGQPSWQRGVTAHRGRPLRLVDLAGVIMPERASATVDEPDTQAYLMVVGGARCGLICDRIKRPQMVATEDVRWSGRYRYRPWARGVLKKELAVLLDVDALLRILGMQNAYD